MQRRLEPLDQERLLHQVKPFFCCTRRHLADYVVVLQPNDEFLTLDSEAELFANRAREVIPEKWTAGIRPDQLPVGTRSM